MSEDIQNDDEYDAAFVRALTAAQKDIGRSVSGMHYNKDTPRSLLEREPQSGDQVTQSVLSLAPQFQLIGDFYDGVAAAVGVNADGLVSSSEISSGAEDLNSALGSSWTGSSGDSSTGGKR